MTALLFLGIFIAAVFILGMWAWLQPAKAPRNADKSVWEARRDAAAARLKLTPPKGQDLELLDSSGKTGDFSTEITGRIRNNTNKKYNYAQVTFQMFDSEGNQVGTALANISGLGPGAVWKFKTTHLGKDAVRFKLNEITGF